MWFEPSADGTGQTISGRGFGDGGSYSARWETSLVSVQPKLPQPILEYHWEGRHPNEPQLFGGKGRIESHDRQQRQRQSRRGRLQGRVR